MLDGKDLYYPGDDWAVILESNLLLKLNDSGTFECSVPYTNPMYGFITDMVSEVSILKNEKEIFCGLVYSSPKDFYLNKKLYAVGELSYLFNSIQPQAVYHDVTPRQFFESLILNHNNQTEEKQHFTVGIVTVKDTNDSLYRYTNYENTLDCIRDKLCKRLNGYLRIRKENGVRYIDLVTLQDYGKICEQPIEFGENLIDYAEEVDTTEFATACLPRGAKLEESPIEGLEAYTDIKSVNNGKDYVFIQEAVEKYGWIKKVIDFNDVTDPGNLKKKAEEWLQDAQYADLTLNLTAIDLSELNAFYDDYDIGDSVHAISTPHGMDRFFPVQSLSIRLQEPQSNQIQLGLSLKKGFVQQNQDKQNNISVSIQENANNNAWLKSLIDNATAMMTGSKGGYKVSEFDEDGRWLRDLYMDAPRKEDAVNVMQVNMNGIGFSREGFDGPYKSAWTINGTFLGEFIAANSIRAGQLSVGDFSNYATVTEYNENTMLPESFPFGGTKRYNPGGIWELQRIDPTKSQYLMLCDYTPNCFKDGDELNAEFEFYPDIDGQKAISIYFYDQNKNHITSYAATFSGELRKWQKYSLDIKMDYIRSDAYYFIIGFDMHDTTKNDVVRRCQIRRKGGSNLIVNGSIQAKSLSFGLGSNLYNCGYDTLDNITNDTIFFKKNDYQEGKPIIVSVNDYTGDGIYPIYGTRCIRVVNTTTDGYVYLGSLQNGYGCIPVRYGQKYRISCYAMTALNAESEASCQIFIAEHKNRDSNAVYHESSEKANVGKSWKRFEMTYTSQASRANPYISLRINVNNNAVVYWCCFQIEEIEFDGQETGTFKPAGTTMVDGSHVITGSLDASKISVIDLKAFNATIADWHIENDYLWTRISDSSYGIIKSVGDVMIAVNSPQKEDTTGATWQLFFDGHTAFGDTAKGGTRSEMYGDRWNMYNNQGFAFRVISAGGVELYGDPDQNPSPYWDFHYNGDPGDYSVRFRCTGYDTLVVEGGTLNTGSDESIKEDISKFDKQMEVFFKHVDPIYYRYKNGTHKKQFGYSANNIEQALVKAGFDPADIGLYSVDAKGLRSLAIGGMDAPNTYMIKTIMKRLSAVENYVLGGVGIGE